MQVSGRGVGCERIGELTGDSTTGLTGELMGDLEAAVDQVVVGMMTGGEAAAVAATRVGEGTEEGVCRVAGDGHSGLLVAGGGEGVVLSGFVFGSSGMNGSEKKRLPGGITRPRCASGSGDGLSGERTTSSFGTGLILDGSILEDILGLSNFWSSSGSTASCSD